MPRYSRNPRPKLEPIPEGVPVESLSDEDLSRKVLEESAKRIELEKELLEGLRTLLQQFDERLTALESFREGILNRLCVVEKHCNITPETKPDFSEMVARLNKAYERYKPKWKQILISRLSERYYVLETSLQRAKRESHRDGIPYQLPNGTYGTVKPEDLPWHIASELTGLDQVKQELTVLQGHGRTGNQISMLEVKAATLEQHTKDLLKTTKLPELPPLLAQALGSLEEPKPQLEPCDMPRMVN